MYFYKLYGSTICSDIEFLQLIEIKDCEKKHADIIIQAGFIQEDIKREETEYYSFGENRSWLINSTTWLLIEDGKRVIYELRPNGNVNYLRTYILGYAMAMLYLQRGEMAIHCAAVSRADNAILIAGESGSGKSSVTDALLDAGYHLMADDMAIVKNDELDEVRVLPGFPYQKLCRDVVTQRGYCLDELIYINEEKDKFLVPYKDGFSVEEKPLKAIFLLALDATADKLSLEELNGIDKFFACADNLFLRRLLNTKRYEACVGKKCFDIASKIPIYLIRRPLRANTLNDITEYIVSLT